MTVPGTPIGDDDDSHLGDFIEDGANTAPIEAAMQAGLRDVVKDILDSLTPREAKVPVSYTHLTLPTILRV